MLVTWDSLFELYLLTLIRTLHEAFFTNTFVTKYQDVKNWHHMLGKFFLHLTFYTHFILWRAQFSRLSGLNFLIFYSQRGYMYIYCYFESILFCVKIIQLFKKAWLMCIEIKPFRLIYQSSLRFRYLLMWTHLLNKVEVKAHCPLFLKHFYLASDWLWSS